MAEKPTRERVLEWLWHELEPPRYGPEKPEAVVEILRELYVLAMTAPEGPGSMRITPTLEVIFRQGIPCRRWKGVTGSGIKVDVFVSWLRVDERRAPEFEAEMVEAPLMALRDDPAGGADPVQDPALREILA